MKVLAGLDEVAPVGIHHWAPLPEDPNVLEVPQCLTKTAATQVVYVLHPRKHLRVRGPRRVVGSKHNVEMATVDRGEPSWSCERGPCGIDRKSTRLNSSHVKISYAVFC